MSKEARKAAVFSCEYSEQNPVYCQQCGGHEHLCRKNKPPDNCRHLHTKRLVLPANKRKQFDEPFAYHCTDCKRTFGEKP